MDPIADMLVQIKNAGAVGKESITVPYSKLKHSIADVLMKEGMVSAVSKTGKKVKKNLEIGLVYNDGVPKINDLKRVSKVSRRIYKGFKDLISVRQGHGMLIISTPKGILTDKEAKKAKVGGEVLFKVW